MSFQNAEASRLIANLIEYAEVVAVNASEGTAQVRIGSDLITPFVPWLAARAGADHAWWPLDVGEWVVVACPGGDVARAVILGAVPTGRHPAHGVSGVWRQTFADGSFVEHAGGKITIHSAGDIDITAGGTITINGARVEIN